jgi:serine/threonine protein kinase
VYKAQHNKTRTLVALKKILGTPENAEEGVSFVTIREIKNLASLVDLSGIVRLYDVFFTREGQVCSSYQPLLSLSLSFVLLTPSYCLLCIRWAMHQVIKHMFLL